MNTEKNLVLPGNPRYQPRSLKDIFGYDNLMRSVGEVELASLEVLHQLGVVPKKAFDSLTPEAREAILNIKTTDVDDIERKITKHDIRAWVRCAQEIVPPLATYIHIILTSYDPLETARALQFRRAHELVVKPKALEIAGIFAEHIEASAKTVMCGRTHGQHALPITVGFWLATILSRILTNLGMMDLFARGLVGKISGAVGAHNAQVGLSIAVYCENAASDAGAPYGDKDFEHRVLRKLGLEPATISTQILPPEPLAYYLHSAVLLSASLAQLGRDCRHLMRSEIAEVSEPFEIGQVGSSTMAHKRNPINFENLEGMYIRTMAEHQKVLSTLISEHQRDLVGSSVARDFPIIIINVVQQLETLLRKNDAGVAFLARIQVSEAACLENLAKSKNLIMAEPIYIALQMAGYEGDAHELINRKAMRIAQEKNVPLIAAVLELAGSEPKLNAAISGIPSEVFDTFGTPEKYVGDSAAKALEIARWARERIAEYN